MDGFPSFARRMGPPDKFVQHQWRSESRNSGAIASLQAFSAKKR
jgi:hypothetical protein